MSTTKKPKLLYDIQKVMQLNHYSIDTERTYSDLPLKLFTKIKAKLMPYK